VWKKPASKGRDRLKGLKIAGLLLFVVFVYLGGDLIANNAAFINSPGVVKRLAVYFTLNRAWTTGGYPLPEVAPRTFYGDPAKLADNITRSIKGFSGWHIEQQSPEKTVIRVEPSFWHHATHLLVTVSPVAGGVRLNAEATSSSGLPDLGAGRNDILNLFHAIGEENAIHPPV
jgi:hypothetical protein